MHDILIKQAVLNSLADRYEVMVLYRNGEGKLLEVKYYTVHSASMKRFYKLSDNWQVTRQFNKPMTRQQYIRYTKILGEK